MLEAKILCLQFTYDVFNCFFMWPAVCVSVYDGPQSYDLNNPDSTTTKVQVLHVTPDASKTEDFSDSEDDIEDIPTINTGIYLV